MMSILFNRLLTVALDGYKRALTALESDPKKLLLVLLARDKVHAVLNKQGAHLGSPTDFEGVVQQDAALRQQVPNLSLDGLPTWRQSRQPPDGHWWWFLDQMVEEQKEEQNLPWFVLTTIFLILIGLTILPALQIITRLWDGAPDIISLFATFFFLLLAASPLTPPTRQLAREWIVNRIPRLNPNNQAQVTMVIVAFIAAVMTFGVYKGAPWLAKYSYNQGFDELEKGQLPTAQTYFEVAVALEPKMAVGYYELAYVYEEMARPDDAMIWYQRALAEDPQLGLAYNNLGRLHLLRGEPKLALQILRQGLSHTTGSREIEIVTRYRLLSNLGWAYHVLEQDNRAREELEQAIALESKIDDGRLSAVPHYYLACTYEALKQPDAAIQQWEESLRYLKKDAVDQLGWEERIRTHLEQLRTGNQSGNASHEGDACRPSS